MVATAIVLGIRARRTQVPPGAEFRYAQAFGSGLLVALFVGLFGAVANYLYVEVINPGFKEILVEANLARLTARGVFGPELEAAETATRAGAHPLVQAAIGTLMALIWGTLVAMIAAAVLRRGEPPWG